VTEGGWGEQQGGGGGEKREDERDWEWKVRRGE